MSVHRKARLRVLAGWFTILWFASGALAQRMPPASRAIEWISPHNQKRVVADLQGVPEYAAKKLPDGTELPPCAPWPFLLYVTHESSDLRSKVDERLFGDTRILLATRGVKLVKISPSKALDLPYLAAVRNLRDPSLVIVDRDFTVRASFCEEKELEERKVLPALTQTHDAEYPVSLAAFLSDMVEILEAEERLWKDEVRASELQGRAASKSGAQAEKLDTEAEEIEARVAEERNALFDREEQVLAGLEPQKEKAEPLPTTFGAGKKQRELTPAELEAIEAYREFSRNDNAWVRAAAVEDLGAIDSGPMVAFILEAASDLDSRVVEAAGRALGRMRSDEALDAMLGGLSASNDRTRRAAILGFANIDRRYAPSIAPLISVLGDSDDELRYAALRALRMQKHPSAVPAVIECLDDGVPALRVLAAQTLGEMRAEAATLPLCEKLADRDWSLQKAAAEALGKIRSRASIEPLLDHFENSEGILVEVIYQALVAVTGQDYSIAPKFWRRWWDNYGDSFQLPSAAEIERMKEAAAKALAKYEGAGKNEYHTITTLSKNMLFVIDVSASMASKITLRGTESEEQLAEFPDRVKMEIAKTELIDLLANLDRQVKFNIITFSSKVDFWKKNMTGAGSRTAAIKYVAKLEPVQPTQARKRGNVGGGDEQKTDTFAALEAAFGLEGTGPDWKKRADADTIFLVTDGQPTTGEIVDVNALVDHFTGLNMTRGFVIHVITFDDHTAAKLGPLAKQNGGQCVVRGF